MIEGSSSATCGAPFASVDVDATRRAVTTVLNDHRLICEHGPLDATMHQCTIGAISIIRLKYGPPVRIEPARRDGFYVAQVPTRGHSKIYFANASCEIDATVAALLLPRAPVAVEWSSQCEQYIVKIPTTTLDRFAETILDTPLYQLREFDQPAILGEPETRALVGLIEYIVQEQPYWGGLQSYQIFCRDAEELLAGCFLLKRPRSSLKFFAGAKRNVVPKYVSEAEAYMRANIHRPLLLSEIAQSVGVSVRTLHKVFHDFRGTTPIAMLQNLRLAAVRNHLLSAASGTRVADVALRWGFAHLGRFSMAYRRKFGEHPRQTIRK